MRVFIQAESNMMTQVHYELSEQKGKGKKKKVKFAFTGDRPTQ